MIRTGARHSSLAVRERRYGRCTLTTAVCIPGHIRAQSGATRWRYTRHQEVRVPRTPSTPLLPLSLTATRWFTLFTVPAPWQQVYGIRTYCTPTALRSRPGATGGRWILLRPGPLSSIRPYHWIRARGTSTPCG